MSHLRYDRGNVVGFGMRSGSFVAVKEKVPKKAKYGIANRNMGRAAPSN